MMLNAGNVLKINITTDPKDTILEYIQKYLNKSEKREKNTKKKTEKPLVIATPNPEQIVLASQDLYFAKMLNRADITLPDGIGLLFAERILGKNSIKRRIHGVEFMQELVALASKESVRIGLIGGKTGLAVEAFKCLQAKHEGLVGWGTDAPSMYFEANELKMEKYDQKMQDQYFLELAKRIIDDQVQMVFVGLGAPKQEYFIERLVHALSLRTFVKQSQGDRHSLQARDDSFPIVLMSVGGSFDLISGRIKRAPHLVRLIGFEWAWRLFQEPWRWKRQLALIKFMWLVCKSRFTK